MLLQASDALFGYRNKPVVRAERIELRAGECLGLFGPNGVGKSTLLRGLTGLLKPMGGTLRLAPSLRTAYVPQHRAMELHWPMTGFDAASLQRSARARAGWLGRAGGASVRAAMEELAVGHLARASFATLSGGQQQRVILAGALADDPSLLVLDEPTEGLDLQSRRSLLDTLAERKRKGLAVLLVSHELEDLIELSDAVAWLHPGRAEAEPSAVEWTTAHDVSARLASAPSGAGVATVAGGQS